MHIDSVSAQQDPTTVDGSPARHVEVHDLVRRALSALWSGARQVAWGIDAFSSVSHGIDVPADHPARVRPRGTARRP